MRSGDADVSAKPAIGLELAEVVEQVAEGVVGRSAGAIPRGLGGGGSAILGFGEGATVEPPGGADDFDGLNLLDGAARVQVLPKGL